MDSLSWRDIREKRLVPLQCIFAHSCASVAAYASVLVAGRLSSVYKRGLGELKRPVHSVHMHMRSVVTLQFILLLLCSALGQIFQFYRHEAAVNVRVK